MAKKLKLSQTAVHSLWLLTGQTRDGNDRVVVADENIQGRVSQHRIWVDRRGWFRDDFTIPPAVFGVLERANYVERALVSEWRETVLLPGELPGENHWREVEWRITDAGRVALKEARP